MITKPTLWGHPRRRSAGAHDVLQVVFWVLSMLALALMPLNMAANAQMHAPSLQVAVPVSDCDMGSKHDRDAADDASLCIIACTGLPAPNTPMLPSSRMTPAALLEMLAAAILDGADLEPVPPPPRNA